MMCKSSSYSLCQYSPDETDEVFFSSVQNSLSSGTSLLPFSFAPMCSGTRLLFKWSRHITRGTGLAGLLWSLTRALNALSGTSSNPTEHPGVSWQHVTCMAFPHTLQSVRLPPRPQMVHFLPECFKSESSAPNTGCMELLPNSQSGSNTAQIA
ncbi:hypothetical protein OGAPHI_004217 [Ogataea philodendri]|uniref:Uncharacterized protein n=1 Tax=Ogataea philodendri TaxID=1378263 RepID=A0A9P8P5S6_9ASCO|nr:uncharacterized protein OGAPHI_004217 [Ogataea philodendri]KAH3666028.1 hypothetical protein OGAPHI_004217 [Ogataea philodendri]